MTSAALEGTPPWLLTGLGLAAVMTVLVAAVFAIAERRFPSPRHRAAERIGGESRRRREIRAYLEAIGEPFAEGHPVAGDPVDFYLPGRDVAITFDAQAYFRIQRTDTHPVLIEHEMPGHHLGARLPFEVPEVEFGPSRDEQARDLQEAIHAAFRALGVPRSATAEELRHAYRQRVKQVHPDHGGTEAEFRRVREAYVTAKEHVETGE